MNLTRRSFLTAIAAGAAALGLPGPAAKAESKAPTQEQIDAAYIRMYGRPAFDSWAPGSLVNGYTQAPGVVTRVGEFHQGLYDAVTDSPTSDWLEPYVQETWVPKSALWFTEDAIQHGDGPSGWTDEGVERIYMIDGVRVSRDVYAAWRRSLHESGG